MKAAAYRPSRTMTVLELSRLELRLMLAAAGSAAVS